MRGLLNYLHFMLELYSKNSYLTGTNTMNTRRVSRKIVKENLILKQFTKEGVNSLFIDFIVYNPN